MLSYQNPEAWKKGMQLVKEIYLISKIFPSDETYALTSQMRRAAVSVPSNIAEGLGRNYKRDTIQFLHISRGSSYELETLLNVAKMVNYFKEEKITEFIFLLIDEEKKILNGLIKSFEQRIDLK